MGENLSQLRTTLPEALNAVKKNYYETVSGLTNQRYRNDPNMRRYTNEYMADLEHQGLGRTDSPEFSARIKAAPSTPQGEGRVQFTTPQEARWWYGEDTANAPVQTSPSASATPTPAPTPTPTPFTASEPRIGFQVGGLVRAPISRRRQAPVAQQLPSYASQAELDAARHPPGTRFHWQPTKSM